MLRLRFWDEFKRYCKRNKVYRRWVLTGVRIPATQLKFYADREKALVLFQIDHKYDLRRYEVYETFLAFQNMFAAVCGDELRWEEEYTGLGDRLVSAIYFELPEVSLYRKEQWETIYRFFVEKMVILEDIYFEYQDIISENLKQSHL